MCSTNLCNSFPVKGSNIYTDFSKPPAANLSPNLSKAIEKNEPLADLITDLDSNLWMSNILMD